MKNKKFWNRKLRSKENRISEELFSYDDLLTAVNRNDGNENEEEEQTIEKWTKIKKKMYSFVFVSVMLKI